MKSYILFLSILSFTCYAQKSAITFEGGDRLGDKLFTYCRAKWLAHQYDLTFLCPHFPYRDEFYIEDHDQKFTKNIRNGFLETKRIKQESEITPGKEDVLYVMDFYMHLDISKSVFDHAITLHFKNDPTFIAELQKCLAPKKELELIALPTDMPTIALHVRRGGGYDNVATCYKRWPTKFPPDQFYLDQIRHIVSRFNKNQPVYIYLFTDDQHPEQMAAKYTKALNMPQLIFDHRVHENYKEHVVDDMFAIAQFDYLIRSNSQYTLLSMILGDHEMIISPSKGSWHNDHAVIDQLWILEKTRNQNLTESYRDLH